MKTTALLAGLAALVAAPAFSFAQLYSVEVIGPINTSYTYATALNNHGVVLGDFGGQLKEIYFSNAGVQTFPGDLGGTWTHATSLNDAGDFVGQYLHNGNYHGFASIGGVVTDLDAIGGAHFSAATGINNAGQIAGLTSTDTAMYRAFLYSGGVMNDLGSLGGNISSAEAINASGQVVGYSTTVANVNHAFLYSGGLMSDLGTLGGKESYSGDVNALGQVVGFSNFDPANVNGTHAFIYTNGAMQDLGTLQGGLSSWARAINDSGVVVGVSDTAGFAHAFISNGQSMTDLNSLVDLSNTGLLELSSANDINASGQITGEARNAQGFTVSYVLTPFSAVPEPSTYSLAGVLMLLVLAFARRLRASPLRRVA